MSDATALCRLEDIPDPGGIDLQIDGAACFAVRRGEAVYLYRNRCPHLGLPLNLTPGRFLDYHRQYIQCSSHGALFEMDIGYCIDGPCRGQQLDILPCQLIDGGVFLRAAD
ncbi:Rieske (2Fe-2S) protein [Porticoccus sp.]